MISFSKHTEDLCSIGIVQCTNLDSELDLAIVAGPLLGNATMQLSLFFRHHCGDMFLYIAPPQAAMAPHYYIQIVFITSVY